MAVRINPLYRFENAVRPRRVISTGNHRLPASGPHGVRNAFIIRGHPDRCQIGRNRPFPDMLNHRLSGDICKRLAGQPCSRHTGRNDDHW